MKKNRLFDDPGRIVVVNACQAARGAGQPFTPIQATPVFPENATPTSPQPVSTIAESPTGSNEQVVQLSVAALSKTLHISVNSGSGAEGHICRVERCQPGVSEAGH